MVNQSGPVPRRLPLSWTGGHVQRVERFTVTGVYV